MLSNACMSIIIQNDSTVLLLGGQAHRPPAGTQVCHDSLSMISLSMKPCLHVYISILVVLA